MIGSSGPLTKCGDGPGGSSSPYIRWLGRHPFCRGCARVKAREPESSCLGVRAHTDQVMAEYRESREVAYRLNDVEVVDSENQQRPIIQGLRHKVLGLCLVWHAHFALGVYRIYRTLASRKEMTRTRACQRYLPAYIPTYASRWSTVVAVTRRFLTSCRTMSLMQATRLGKT